MTKPVDSRVRHGRAVAHQALSDLFGDDLQGVCAVEIILEEAGSKVIDLDALNLLSVALLHLAAASAMENGLPREGIAPLLRVAADSACSPNDVTMAVPDDNRDEVITLIASQLQIAAANMADQAEHMGVDPATVDEALSMAAVAILQDAARQDPEI